MSTAPTAQPSHTGPTASSIVHDLLIRGVRVRYRDTGSGPPLVLVHGFLVDSSCWSLVTPALAAKHRVIAIDLPGFGASERPRDWPYTREAFSEVVRDLLAGLDIPRAHIAGHSLGGAVAATLAADFPEVVDRLAIINALAYPFDLPLKGRIPLVPILGPFVFKRLYNRALFHDYFKSNVFAPGFAYDRAMVDAYYDAFNTPESREAAYRVLPQTVDLASMQPRYGRIRAPTLVLWGELDPMFPVSFAQRLAKDIPSARVETLPGCGHAPPEEMPARTAEILLRHFASTGGA